MSAESETGCQKYHLRPLSLEHIPTIARWHERQKLSWIAPGDASLTLREDTPSPYEDTPGEGVNQVIRGGVLSTAWLPNGAEPDPWHSHVHD